MFHINAQFRTYTDVDSDAFSLNAVSLLYSINAKTRADFSYVSYENYNSHYEATTTLPYVMAGFMATNTQVPISLLENFIN
jgi:hypothetical protein